MEGNVSVEVDFDVVQRRTNTMSCAEGFSMDAIFRSRSIHCAHDMEHYVRFSGDGLTGGGEIGDITIAVNFSRVQQRQSSMACAEGEFIQSITQAGAVECALDLDSGGDIASVAVGLGLTGANATQGDVAINVDYNIVQARCFRMLIGIVDSRNTCDGTVSCELDNDSGGDLTSISVSNGLTGGGQVGDLTISANTSYLQAYN